MHEGILTCVRQSSLKCEPWSRLRVEESLHLRKLTLYLICTRLWHSERTLLVSHSSHSCQWRSPKCTMVESYSFSKLLSFGVRCFEFRHWWTVDTILSINRCFQLFLFVSISFRLLLSMASKLARWFRNRAQLLWSLFIIDSFDPDIRLRMLTSWLLIGGQLNQIYQYLEVCLYLPVVRAHVFDRSRELRFSLSQTALNLCVFLD